MESLLVAMITILPAFFAGYVIGYVVGMEVVENMKIKARKINSINKIKSDR